MLLLLLLVPQVVTARAANGNASGKPPTSAIDKGLWVRCPQVYGYVKHNKNNGKGIFTDIAYNINLQKYINITID